RVDAQLVAESEVPADPGRSGFQRLVVVAGLQVQCSAVGNDRRLDIVMFLGREVAEDAGAELPGRRALGMLRGSSLGGLLRGEDAGGEDECGGGGEPSGRAHPPSAIVRATSTMPRATIARPVRHGRNPENTARR